MSSISSKKDTLQKLGVVGKTLQCSKAILLCGVGDFDILTALLPTKTCRNTHTS